MSDTLWERCNRAEAERDTALSNLEAVKGELRGARGLLERTGAFFTGTYPRVREADFCVIRDRLSEPKCGTCEACVSFALLADIDALALPSPAEPADPVAAMDPATVEACALEALETMHPTCGSPCRICEFRTEIYHRIRALASQLSKTGEGTR